MEIIQIQDVIQILNDTSKSSVSLSSITWCVTWQVFSVVKEQITRALERQPLTFDLFRHELQHLTYAEITRIWTQERRNKEDWESHSRPIVWVARGPSQNSVTLN